MRLYALNGDRAAALHIYHPCVAMLHRELDVEADATTKNFISLSLQAKP